jgi:hypothetical protein
VKVGAVAYGDGGAEFVPGRYVKHGYIFTSRCCPRTCWFCTVRKRTPVPFTEAAFLVADGKLTEPEIAAKVGVGLTTLQRWKKDTRFSARVGENKSKLASVAAHYAVAQTEERLATYDDLFARLKQVIAERATDPVLAKAPGGKTEFYDGWWAGVEKLVDDFSPISVGSAKQNPVCLTGAEWAIQYCDNLNDLRSGVRRNGPWHLLVEQDGEYEVGLRRWPREAGAAIRAGVPAFKGVDGGLPAGTALPVRKARLKIAGLDEMQPVGEKDEEVVFTVLLKAGARLPMQSWFYDADGQELCGAYFAYVRRK